MFISLLIRYRIFCEEQCNIIRIVSLFISLTIRFFRLFARVVIGSNNDEARIPGSTSLSKAWEGSQILSILNSYLLLSIFMHFWNWICVLEISLINFMINLCFICYRAWPSQCNFSNLHPKQYYDQPKLLKKYYRFYRIVKLFSWMFCKQIYLCFDWLQLNIYDLGYLQIKKYSCVFSFLQRNGKILMIGSWAY